MELYGCKGTADVDTFKSSEFKWRVENRWYFLIIYIDVAEFFFHFWLIVRGTMIL